MTDLEKFIAELEEPRLGIHEDGTEELKTWEQLYEQCAKAAAWLKEHSRCEAARSLLTQEQITAIALKHRAKCPFPTSIEPFEEAITEALRATSAREGT